MWSQGYAAKAGQEMAIKMLKKQGKPIPATSDAPSSSGSGTKSSSHLESSSSLPKNITVGGNASSNNKRTVLDAIKEILESIRQVIEAHTTREGDINKKIALQLERARARRAAGNTTGAVLSMRNIKRFQVELLKLAEAIDLLETYESELETKLQQDQALNALESATISMEEISLTEDISITSGDHSTSTPSASSPFDLSKYRNASRKVAKILSMEAEEEEIKKATDEELLKELENWPSAA